MAGTEIVAVADDVLAFVRPTEGANLGLIRTAEGPVLIDTAFPAQMRGILDAAGVKPAEARLLLNTHFHEDHTWGNQLFACPIVAHRLCRERILALLEGGWRADALAGWVAGTGESAGDEMAQRRQTVDGLPRAVPTDTFEARYTIDIGAGRLEVIHLGGHTPDLSVVWLPDAGVLFASDLLFIGRYPYLADADVPAWIAALDRLPRFGARVIVPGHGPLCGEDEIAGLAGHLQAWWDLTCEHVAAGHAVEEALADERYPTRGDPPDRGRHERNLRAIYGKVWQRG